MAPPNTNRHSSFDSLFATTLENMSSEMVDNAAQHIPLFFKLDKKQNIKLDGGTEIVRSLEYVDNSTYSRISGYDEFDITPQDPFTAANYQYKQVVITTSVSDEEKWKNSGKEKMIDLVEAKAKNTMHSLQRGLDADCYSDGTASGGKQIGGLQLLVPADPTASSVVGGINQSTWEFWRSVSKTTSTDFSAVMSATNATSYVRKMKHLLKRNDGGPDMALVTNNFFDFLALALEGNGRYAGDKDSIDAGFESIKYCNIDFINAEEADGNIPSTYNYFLDSKTLYFVIHKDRNMVPLEGDRTVVEQAASIKPITFVGNLITTCRRNQGLLIDA